MIGIVLSGHGEFASGLNSSIQLIAGKQAGFQVVDFSEGMSSDDLQEALKVAVESVEQGQGTVIFTDIPGGTPFNQSVILSTKKEKLRVVSGTNLPALLDGSFSRELVLGEFVSKVLLSGKEGLQEFVQKKKISVDSEMEDGI
ncbi:PTS system, N-acetylgalactosamine-specific IIA component [Carnobacterium iners]|uniref:PTS system, N-acetylgalactosamine-specific IIA component n=1 Tax=Carnobacterium iners TaxID=1073423 RepID=A0A1X7NDG3_9LACT|nr:PTS galactosamine/N-acetylgalactosamine transporter subunit IIA [Carnobacterium iners]SEK53249.1 PTS system, N-acetylgalactosamine-specific IIA component [Carnobacterium iners]SMH34848.1 PTS system, N-acetylgalactosamine-specific IIA component [Carnobacterium iners]